MVAENKPMVALKDKITSKNLLISDLGTLKGKVASFQTALQNLQNPAALSEVLGTSSDESVVKITSSATAIKGRHDIVVSQVAQPAQITFDQFASSTANAGLASGDTFSITIGTRTYAYTPPTGVTWATTTIEDLKNWVNARDDNLSASIVPTSGSNYALKIQGTEPGSDNAITYSHTKSLIRGTSADPSLDNAGFVAGNSFSLSSGGQTYTNTAFTNLTTIGDVKAWVDAQLPSSSIDGSNRLVLSNGATYTTSRSGSVANTPITGNTGATSDLAGFVAGDIFSLSYGGNTYTNSSFTNTTTISQVQTWISSQLPSSSINAQKQLVVSGASYSYSRSVSGLGVPVVAPTVVAAQDASFTLDGVAFTRKTNTITDALSGATINLIKSDAGAKSISIDKGNDKAPEVIQGLVDAFNDLVATAKKLSAKSSPSSSSSANGSLANSPTALSFMNQIKNMLAGDIHYTLGGVENTLNMGDLGFEMQFDGTAKFNATTFNSANNIATILASGIKVGYSTYVVRDKDTGEELSKTTTDVTLDSYLTSLLKNTTSTTASVTTVIAGAFDRQIKNEQSSLAEMNKKQAALQTRLDEKQKSYYSQYSALNALLFKLSNTSNSLTNALSGLTNGQNNN